MKQQWTFGRKIAVGFGLTTLLAAILATIAILSLRGVASTKDEIINVDVHSVREVLDLRADIEHIQGEASNYILDGRQDHLDKIRAVRADLARRLPEVRALLHTAEQHHTVDELRRCVTDYEAAADRAFEAKKNQAPLEQLSKMVVETLTPLEEACERLANELIEREEKEIAEKVKDGTESADTSVAIMVGAVIAILLLAVFIAVFLSRSLSRQIGSAIQHVQSSSAELQAAANQQAAGAREQTSATQEVTTTLKELSATSRQMSESAQRVTKISEDTVSAGRAGDTSVQTAQEAILAIKRQVDLVVTHMLDLGKKSQQVGAVLEIINELAEQTNILAINATIESAGAGEAGKRFAVVADEIRKLADRVGGSTKEIRTLIDEIRTAANTTVMATEDGAKAVESGTRQFGEVTHAFRKIVGMMQNTSDAAREIELGARQQVTAVDQVNVALQNVTQAVRDTEASTKDTLETSTQLATLSRNLIQLVKPQAG